MVAHSGGGDSGGGSAIDLAGRLLIAVINGGRVTWGLGRVHCRSPGDPRGSCTLMMLMMMMSQRREGNGNFAVGERV